MQFALSEERVLLKEAVERFVRARYGAGQRKAYRAEAPGYSAENWRGLADLGILGLNFPSEHGGLAGGPKDLATVTEALGSGYVVEPFLEEIVLGGGALARLGSAAQQEGWLPRIAAGEAHVTVAHVEHAARFNVSDVRLRVERAGDAWSLTGEKSVVPVASVADAWVVSAREHGGPTDPRGIAFFLVAPDASGIERQDFRLTDGALASSIRFRGTPALERLPGGFAEFLRVLDYGRLAAGGEMLGIMATMLESTLDYLRSRKQFGVPLSSFQALQHRLADLYVLLEQSRSQVCRASLFIDKVQDEGRSVAGMKSYVSRAAVAMGEACVHMHGGIGMSDDLVLGHGFKRLLVLAHLLGDSDSELSRYSRARTAAAAAAG